MTWHAAIGRKEVAGEMDASAGGRTCPAAREERGLGFGLREKIGESHIFIGRGS